MIKTGKECYLSFLKIGLFSGVGEICSLARTTQTAEQECFPRPSVTGKILGEVACSFLKIEGL